MRVALIFGGPSGEHAISLVSASSVARGLEEAGHQVLPMAIDRHGLWCSPDSSVQILRDIDGTPAETSEFQGSLRLDPRLLNRDIDIVFPMIHGPFGEDGTIQGLLEALNLPYVGCGIEASALCMDKIRSKELVGAAGIPTAPSLDLDRRLPLPPDLGARAEALGFPLFVKPARMGSSVGISRVTSLEELQPAVEEAFHWDREILVEKGLDVREIELAVLGNESPRVSLPGEIRPGEGFYDFEGKYLKDSTELLAPAPLVDEQRARLQEKALRIYTILGCEGMARVDLFIEKNSDEITYNEVNTIPGFTSISMYPKLWAISGLPFPDLLNQLLQLGFQRHAERSQN